MSEDIDIMLSRDLNRLRQFLQGGASRATTWRRVLEALSGQGRFPAQVIEVRPDGLDVVADSRGGQPVEMSLEDLGELEACIDSRHPRYVGVGADRVVVALLPLIERDEVTAVLRVERPAPLTPRVMDNLDLFAFAVGACLTERSWALETRLVTELSTTLATVTELEAGAAASLERLIRGMDASAGVLLEMRAGEIVRLADRGSHAVARQRALLEGSLGMTGWAREVFSTGEPRFTRNYGELPGALSLPSDPIVLAMPLEPSGVPRRVLILTFDPARFPARVDVGIIRGVGRVLTHLLDGLGERRMQDELISLVDTVRDEHDYDACHRLLAIAVKGIPGAARGTLLIREANQGPFAFRAAYGYDLGSLWSLTQAESQALAWYAPNGGSWGRGTPRILTAWDVNFQRTAQAVGLPLDETGRDAVLRIKANLVIPVRFAGEVQALLSLDNLTRADAFGVDSVRLANQVAVTAAAILHSIRDRAVLEVNAITDPVTGVLNRRGGEDELGRALARAAREGEPLSVLMFDMTDFKSVNDTFGHGEGDRVLLSVAKKLRENLREGDVVARWGGDEFLAVLPRQGPDAAERTMRRLAEAVGVLQIGEHHLSINIGCASYTVDATSPEELVRLADERMYSTKAHRVLNPPTGVD